MAMSDGSEWRGRTAEIARWPLLGHAKRSRSSARRSTGKGPPHLPLLASPHTDSAFELKTRIKIFLELKHASIIQSSKYLSSIMYTTQLMLNLPMVSICVHLERSFTGVTVMAEQFLEGDNSSNGQRDFTSDEGFPGDSSQSLQGHTSYDAHGCEDTEEQVR